MWKKYCWLSSHDKPTLKCTLSEYCVHFHPLRVKILLIQELRLHHRKSCCKFAELLLNKKLVRRLLFQTNITVNGDVNINLKLVGDNPSFSCVNPVQDPKESAWNQLKSVNSTLSRLHSICLVLKQMQLLIILINLPCWLWQEHLWGCNEIYIQEYIIKEGVETHVQTPCL